MCWRSGFVATLVFADEELARGSCIPSAAKQFELVTGLTAEPGLTQPFLTEFSHPIRDTCSMSGVVANGFISRRHTSRAEGEGRDHRPTDQMLHHDGKSKARDITAPHLKCVGYVPVPSVSRKGPPKRTALTVTRGAGVDRFQSKDAFARHNGTAPLPVWSSNRVVAAVGGCPLSSPEMFGRVDRYRHGVMRTGMRLACSTA